MHQVFGTVKTWDGSSSGNWSTTANWIGNIAPVNGDQLVFPSTATRFAITSDFSNLKLGSITFRVTNAVTGAKKLFLLKKP